MPIDGNTPSGEEKTFTQADVDKLVQDRLARDRRQHEKDTKEMRDLIEALKAEIADLKKPSIPPAPTPAPAPIANPELEGQLKILERKFEGQLGGLKTELESERKKGAEERKRRLELERDRELDKALTDQNCIDLEAGRRYFLPQIDYDETDATWMFNLKAGGSVRIAQGVEAELPSYLKAATINRGGSGVTGMGRSKKADLQTQLESARKELEVLDANARRTGRDADLAKAHQQRRRVQALEREFTTAK